MRVSPVQEKKKVNVRSEATANILDGRQRSQAFSDLQEARSRWYGINPASTSLFISDHGVHRYPRLGSTGVKLRETGLLEFVA